jgi:hypothetical protein
VFLTVTHTSDVMASPTSFALTEGGSLFSFAARTSAAEREVPRMNQGERRSGKKRPRGPCQKLSKVSALVYLLHYNGEYFLGEKFLGGKYFFIKKKSHRALVGQAADLAAITVDAREEEPTQVAPQHVINLVIESMI